MLQIFKSFKSRQLFVKVRSLTISLMTYFSLNLKIFKKGKAVIRGSKVEKRNTGYRNIKIEHVRIEFEENRLHVWGLNRYIADVDE